jgi:SH3-like domain-containing protein
MQPGSRSILLAAALLVALAAPAALAQGRATRDADSLPRWQSLKSDNVNLRVGPGNQHPIEWVVRRRHLPVRVLAESDQWRKVRDSNGTEGWISRALLSGARYGVVSGEIRTLRRDPAVDAVAVARLEPGVVG